MEYCFFSLIGLGKAQLPVSGDARENITHAETKSCVSAVFSLLP